MATTPPSSVESILAAVTAEAVQQEAIDRGAPVPETRTRMERAAVREALEISTSLDEVKAILHFMNRE